jgi:putative spermidine/putrescine transport system permease protein
MTLLWATAAAPIALGLVHAALYSVGLTGLLARGFTLAPWWRVLARAETWRSLALSAWVAAASVALAAALGLVLALALRARLRRGPIAAALHVPLAVPGTVAAFVTFQAFTGGGIASRLAAAAGLGDGPAPVVSLVHGPLGAGVIAAHLLSAAPFFALLFASLYDGGRVAEMAAMARTFGAGRAAVLARVEVPVLLHRAAPSLALFFVVVLGSFEIPLLLAREEPQMISVLTLRRFSLFDIAQRPEAYALALLFTASVLAAIVLLLRRDRELDAA